MKFHRPVLQTIPQALTDIFENGYYADKVIERQLKAKGSQWGSRDRKAFAQTVYDIVRWYRRIQMALPLEHRENPWVLLQAWITEQEADFPQLQEFISFDLQKFRKAYGQDKSFAIHSSYPDWMYKRCLEELGEKKTQALFIAMNQPAPIYLRANPLRISIDSLQKQLREEGIETEIVDGELGCLKLIERKNVFITKAFKAGYFEMQDLGSQKIAPFLQAVAKLRVLDACAGAGGKTLHLAQVMGNKGKIVATDIHEKKLVELKRRARRNQVDLVETRVVDRKWSKRQKEKFARILLDVPCTGLGVIKRNPDTKWKLQPERLEELIEIQRSILEESAPMLKPGGKMVYATCSLLPSENQNQIHWFLQQHPQWELEEELILSPDTSATDGFYAARLVKA